MEDKKVIAIMACDPSGVIGNNGAMPWRFESELQNFLKIVKGGVLIMGRKTLDSLPKSLKDKHNCVVFTKNSRASCENNITFISSLRELWQLKLPRQSELFMIGGAEIAQLFLRNNLISEFILTITKRKYSGDTRLDLSLLNNWKKEMISFCEDYSIYRYTPIIKG